MPTNNTPNATPNEADLKLAEEILNAFKCFNFVAKECLMDYISRARQPERDELERLRVLTNAKSPSEIRTQRNQAIKERDAAQKEAEYLRTLLKDANENKLPRVEEVQLIYQLTASNKALELAKNALMWSNAALDVVTYPKTIDANKEALTAIEAVLPKGEQ